MPLLILGFAVWSTIGGAVAIGLLQYDVLFTGLFWPLLLSLLLGPVVWLFMAASALAHAVVWAYQESRLLLLELGYKLGVL